MSKKRTRGPYAKTTPIGRVLKNLRKIERAAGVTAQRLTTWERSGDQRITALLGSIRGVGDLIAASIAAALKMEDEGWSPPKKSLVITFEPGTEVMVSDRYRDKWAQVYPAKVLDNLTVVNMVEAGVIVRSGSNSPFLISKSHIEKRGTEDRGRAEKKPARNGVSKHRKHEARASR